MQSQPSLEEEQNWSKPMKLQGVKKYKRSNPPQL